MISIINASKILTKKYPKRTIQSGYDYDNNWWLFEATEGNEINYDSPYYVVNKKTGDVKTFSPIPELDKFSYALENRRIM